MTRASSACRAETAIPARRMILSSSLAELAIRCRSPLRYSASLAFSALTADSSTGQSPPITQGVQSMGELNAGTVRDSRAALRRRWRAVFRPKIATG